MRPSMMNSVGLESLYPAPFSPDHSDGSSARSLLPFLCARCAAAAVRLTGTKRRLSTAARRSALPVHVALVLERLCEALLLARLRVRQVRPRTRGRLRRPAAARSGGRACRCRRPARRSAPPTAFPCPCPPAWAPAPRPRRCRSSASAPARPRTPRAALPAAAPRASRGASRARSGARAAAAPAPRPPTAPRRSQASLLAR